MIYKTSKKHIYVVRAQFVFHRANLLKHLLEGVEMQTYSALVHTCLAKLRHTFGHVVVVIIIKQGV